MPVDFAHLPIYILQAHEAPPAETHAAAEGGHAPGFGLDFSWQGILNSNLLNVLLVLAVLAFVVKKFNLFAGVESQRERIAKEIEAVEAQKRQALEQLEDIKTRTANLKSEVEDILRNARESAETLSAQIVADAREESTKIVDNARRRVELEQRGAIKDLEARLLSEALADAREELARSLTAADQRRSVEDFLAELPNLKEDESR